MTVIHEPIIRLAAFIAVLAAMVLWETVAPRRSRSHARIQRWPSNFAIVALNTGILRINIPIAELPDPLQELKNTKMPILAV